MASAGPSSAGANSAAMDKALTLPGTVLDSAGKEKEVEKQVEVQVKEQQQEEEEEEVISDDSFIFEVSYAGSKHTLVLPPGSTVGDLKDELCTRLGVQPQGQKVIGLPKAPPASSSSTSSSSAGGGDLALLSSLTPPLKRPAKVILMGTPDADLARLRNLAIAAVQDAETGVLDDLPADEDEEGDEAEGGTGGTGRGISRRKAEEQALLTNDLVLARVERRIRTYRPKMLAGFRAGKKTLVLDIDYTLIDHRTVVERPMQMARPFLHDFLAAAYKHYDIVIWSATSMKWIELKMRELNVSTHPDFRLAAFMCGAAMVTVHLPSKGPVDVKPLGVLWGIFPEHTKPSTTIMFDDLRRNFLLNRAQGLVIEPCRKLPTIRDTDTELRDLAEYLQVIAELGTFEGLSHKHWRSYLAGEQRRRRRRARAGGSGPAAAGAAEEEEEEREGK